MSDNSKVRRLRDQIGSLHQEVGEVLQAAESSRTVLEVRNEDFRRDVESLQQLVAAEREQRLLLEKERAQTRERCRRLEEERAAAFGDLRELAYHALDLEERLLQLVNSRSWRAMSGVRKLTAALKRILRGQRVSTEVAIPARPAVMKRGMGTMLPLDDAAPGQRHVDLFRSDPPEMVRLEVIGKVASSAIPSVKVPVDVHRFAADGALLPTFGSLSIERKAPSGFPFDLTLPGPVGNKNDFGFLLDAIHQLGCVGDIPDVSLHVVTWLRDAEGVRALGAALGNQTLPRSQFKITAYVDGVPDPADIDWADEVVAGNPWQQEKDLFVADDPDDGVLVFLDAMMYPDYQLLEKVVRHAAVTQNIMLGFTTNEGAAAAGAGNGGKALTVKEEWRRARYPFRNVLALNFAIPAKLFRHIGGLERRFNDPRKAAMELAYRAYNMGAYIIPIVVAPLSGAIAGVTRSSREQVVSDEVLFQNLCPVPWYRKVDGSYEVPKVSIYIPAYNAARFISEAIDSVLQQDFKDVEVCIHIDGATDDTLAVLESKYAEDVRVRWAVDQNAGIGHASNRAISLARGLYIGQLDADDRLKPGAIRRMVDVLDGNPDIGCAYSSCERIDADGNYIQDEYSWPEFSREKMVLTSIVHHFRMFRRQAWERTEKFREDITNAVDYDMFLKLSDVTLLYHVDEKLYQRRWHGGNTSLVNEERQTRNTYIVQEAALERNGLAGKWNVVVPDPTHPRRVTYIRSPGRKRVFFWPDYSRSNPYQRALYRSSLDAADFIAGDIEVALQATRNAHDPENIVFHIHWLNPLIQGARSGKELRKRLDSFLGKVKKLQWLGGKVIWTIHNCVSHDTEYVDIEKEFSASLAATVDRIHIHAGASLEEIEEFFPVPCDKVMVSRHGSYNGIYPNYMPRQLARHRLGFDADERVVLFFGQIRPYKGLESLLGACEEIAGRHPRLRLLLAGKANYDVRSQIDSFVGLRDKIHLINRHIEDSELHTLLNAADISAFPYRRILTSGSLMLSLTFGLPSVVPAVGMVREVMANGKAGIAYGAGCRETTVAQALSRSFELMEEGCWEEFRADARRLADEARWPDFIANMQLYGSRDTVHRGGSP